MELLVTINRDVVRAKLTEKMLTQTEVARSAGISLRAFQSSLSGHACRPTTARALAKALDIELQEIATVVN